MILPYLKEMIDERTTDVNVAGDLFSGSGVVSHMLKSEGYDVISNDLMYFCYVLLRGSIALQKQPKFAGVKGLVGEPISFFNHYDLNALNIDLSRCFIYNNYSPRGGRMYLQENNALKIDFVRLTIEEWKQSKLINDDEYYYLLASLIEAIPYISNIAGVYGAYLKFWDNRSFKKLELVKPSLVLNGRKATVFNTDANELIKNTQMDLCYMDPPYNQRQYLPNYHLLETVAKYDYPAIKGITGMRDYGEQEKSDYCVKSKVMDAFNGFIKTVNARYIIVSYNTEGLLATEEMTEILERHGKKGTFELRTIEYDRYKNAQTKSNKNLREQLYFIEKEISDE